MRAFVKRVAFRNSFQLPGMAIPHAPGEFDIRVEEEPLDLVWEAYHRTMSFLLTSGGLTEVYSITEADLDALLAADQAISQSSV